MDCCDNVDIQKQRFKDLSVDTNKGDRFFTIYVNYCNNCGDIQSIDY